ncbi:MAG: hypothetical protein HYX75_02600 [Acidobacteria bacterium]|nr:hypothetical protein [Acidobacteriota bacterium]
MKSPGLNKHIGGAVIAWVLIAAGFSYAKPDAVPNLVGEWKFTVVNGVSYKDVRAPDAEPVFASGVPEGVRLVVSQQQGLIFAGYLEVETNKQWLTGVILTDNSILMQSADSASRNFFRGTYTASRGKKLIKGIITGFEELTASEPGIGSEYFQLVKK